MSKKRKQSWVGLIFRALVLLFCLTLLQAGLLRYINPPVTPNVAWEWAESVIRERPDKRPAYHWRDIRDISPHLRRAVLAAEDQRFLSHRGFDRNEIERAIQEMIQKRRLRGASTISMQTARSVFLLSSRSMVRKAAEVYYTVLIELFWSKQRILEMYLNTVDWGSGVTGAEAAAQKYFSKSARDLTRDQAALMAAILPSPHRWSATNPSPYVKARQAWIMRYMNQMPLI